ncbi:MAG: HNH endonuclease [Candidatus ainarchaeum sp.]|nr:HNH endonuclease [Candidatus ainarchaeum sp.]
MKQLFPSYANPNTWRTIAADYTGKDEWKQIRLKILERDNYSCQYCGFKCDKWQIVHHIDGNPNNNQQSNLMVVCQMCNLIEHAGMGCVLQGIVDLYKKAKYGQNEIVAKTRELRAAGKIDAEIIRELGLEEKVEFKQDWNYLRPLFGFVTSRKATDEKTNIALAYQCRTIKNQAGQGQQQRNLADF